MAKAVLFDLDGVTIDTEPLYTIGEGRLFREYGVVIPDEDWKLFRGISEDKFYSLSMEKYQIKENPVLFREKGRKYVLEAFENNVKFMPGLLSLVQRIKPFFKIGLVTASPWEIFEWLDEQLGIYKIFKNVLCGDAVSNPKPHPEPYLKMIERLKITPKETVIIEDSIHGINSGLAAGSNVIALTGSVPISDIPKSALIIHHLDEISPEMINSF